MRLAAWALLAVIPPVSAAPAGNATSADAFLRRLYAPYLAGDARVAPVGRTAPLIFDDRLTRLIRKDQADAHGEVGALDHDPICDCQDFDRLKSLSIRVWPLGVRSVIANVRFVNGTTPVLLRYTMTRFGAGWRVTDIRSKDMPSLVDFLNPRRSAH